MQRPISRKTQPAHFKRRCHRCSGSGRAPCQICNGTGQVPQGTDLQGNRLFGRCSGCMGNRATRCSMCGGEGLV